MRGGGYKLHNTGSSGNRGLTVPAEIAELIPPETRFDCELTEEGILYRPRKQPASLPSWVRPEDRGDDR